MNEMTPLMLHIRCGQVAVPGWVNIDSQSLPASFAEIEVASDGERGHEKLRGLEKHERYIDDPELPHVLVVGASGSGSREAPELETPLADFLQATAAR